jgi:starch-binding outer membrane protein, SusD/RagB family
MKARLLFIAGVVLGLAACDELLTETPGSFITTDNYYTTPAEINAAAMATYAALTETNAFRRRYHWTIEQASDQARFHPDEPNVINQAPQFLNWVATDVHSEMPWRGFYKLIQRANIVIERAAEAEFTNAAQQQALIGEGKFMRAFGYFWLVRIYGGVPLYVTLDEQRRSEHPRATEVEVLDQIIRDASEAADGLPRQRTGNQLGRATQGAALALLADAYRWKANVVSQNRDDWQGAADAAKRIIDSNLYALTDDYLDAFLPGSEHRAEEIFAVQFAGMGSSSMNDNVGGIYLARNIPGVVGWAVVSPTLEFYRSYPDGDYRHDVTFRTRACRDGSDTGCATEDKIDFSPQNFPGSLTRGYPHVWKYRPSDFGRNMNGAGDVNSPIYRYADVLLIYAEAQFELGNHADALAHVNLIRARARQGTGNENRAEPADLTAAELNKDAIYQERSWELSYELKRWFDLVQRGPEYFVSQLTTNNPHSTQLGYVIPQRMRLPIPAEEIQKNPRIEQNPGY